MKAGERFRFKLLPRERNIAQTFMVPALRKLREERGTHFLGEASEIKGRATRLVPARIQEAIW
jgi:hypothetical protein